jgi:uncharacterized membrane protein YbaN (DUF454 family)
MVTHATAAAAGTGPGPLRRTLYAGLGCGCVGLGVLGAVVPGLPTTVFLLAASYLFTRSSPALERRLREHRRLGPYLARFAATGGMPRRAKAAALASMWAGIALSCVALAAVGTAAQAATVALGLVGTATLLCGVRTADPLGPARG